ncbi:MAG: hypothetical protein HY554_06045 [Elusimicrobia bacterium]|nr:hypothetical protein [Elusimicrobiota bacterium]
MKRIIALVALLLPQPGLATVRVANLAAAKAANLQVIPVHLSGSQGGLRLDLQLAPAGDALFGPDGRRLPGSATFSSSNGPAFAIGKDPKSAGRDLHARLYAGDSSRYGELQGQARGDWKRPEKVDLARALHEVTALQRWGRQDPELVVPVVEAGWTADEASADGLPYLVFSASRKGKIVSGTHIVRDLHKPGNYEALVELLDRLPALAERLAEQGIFAPKFDPTAVVIDKTAEPAARLIKSRLDDRDAEIVRYLRDELQRPDLVGEVVSEPGELRAFYARRLALMREQAEILEARRQGETLFKGGRATGQARIARLLLHAVDQGKAVRWSYAAEGKAPKIDVVKLNPKGLKHADWLKGFVTLDRGWGALRRIDRVEWAELAD